MVKASQSDLFDFLRIQSLCAEGFLEMRLCLPEIFESPKSPNSATVSSFPTPRLAFLKAPSQRKATPWVVWFVEKLDQKEHIWITLAKHPCMTWGVVF